MTIKKAMSIVKNIWVKLEGKKTYLVALAIGVVACLKFLGWIDSETAEMLNVILAGGGLASLRAAKK